MAQLVSRGTLTRGRWDYFEHSNGWASVYGSTATGAIGAYYANNASGTLQVDIYSLFWACSVSSTWQVQLLPPPLILTAITPTDTEIHACQPDAAQPVGSVGMFSAYGGPFFTIFRGSNSVSGQFFNPVANYPFVTLPPGWAISVGGVGGSGTVEMSMNVWFQPMLDNVPPAP